jgi:SAM-dependent methyltransferase
VINSATDIGPGVRDPPAENQQLWDEWSDDFQALWNADTDEEAPPAPCPFTEGAPGGEQPDLLPSVDGIDFVELGCGGGQATVGTAVEGAARAVGVDFSGGQLEHARPLRDHYGVDAAFVQGDVTGVPLADDSFDAAFSGWVLQMVEDLDAYFAEAHRVLRDEGVLVFDLPHPFYELFDPETATLERSYHGDPRRTITISEEYESRLVVFDRTVGDLHDAAVAGGFDVRRVLEPGSDDPEDYDDDDLLPSNQPDLMAMVPRSLRFWAVPS